MTDLEYAAWIKAHKALHSDFAAWADSQPDEARKLLSEQFCRALRDVSYADAVAVSEGLIAGAYEPLPQWEYNRGWNLTARHVAMLSRATTSTHAIPHRSRGSRRPETFSCVPCRDTGLRTVYSWRSVESVALSADLRELLAGLADEPKPEPVVISEDEDGEGLGAILRGLLRGAEMVRVPVTPARTAAKQLRTQNVLCDCHEGEALWRVQGQQTEGDRRQLGRRWTERQRYDPGEHCDCSGGDVVKHAAKLAEWVEWKMSAEAKPNYTDAFGEYNEA